MDNPTLNMLLAIERNLIKQIEFHKKSGHTRTKIIQKLERHLKTIQNNIDKLSV